MNLIIEIIGILTGSNLQAEYKQLEGIPPRNSEPVEVELPVIEMYAPR